MLIKKSFVIIAMAILMVLTSAFSVSASSTLPDEVVIEIEENDDYITRANYLVIDNEAIYSSDKTWDQPNGYDSYRVSITNTSSERLYFTVSYGSKEYSDSVAAHDNHVFVVNNAHYVKHTISFSSGSGALSGTVSVRVSNTPLTVS